PAEDEGDVMTPQTGNNEAVLAAAKHYRYKPVKFSADFGSLNLNSNVLITRYQPYTNASGPVRINNSTPLNGMIRLGTMELLEDMRITGAFRLSTNLKDNEWMGSFQYLKR